MTRLDDFLEPLNCGVWEVAVPKGEVTEPLDTEWKKSAINVPSPDTIASYRKGRFHVHETTDEWRVHLDRYDPEKHPVMHLIDDAPLLLMISDTFMTLILDSRRADVKDTAGILAAQRFIWQEETVYGLVLVLVALFILSDPLRFFASIFEHIIPLVITAIGVIFLVRALPAGQTSEQKKSDIRSAAGMFCAGILAFWLPLALWVITVLVILALWMMASAVMLLARVMKGRHAVPEGFYSRMAIGIVSLAFAVILIINPWGIIVLFVDILGAVTALLGVTLFINGIRLRRWMLEADAG